MIIASRRVSALVKQYVVLEVAAILLLTLILSTTLLGIWNRSDNSKRQIRIGMATVYIEEAIGSAHQAQGLGGRAELAGDHGMLFRFSNPTVPVFWMKGMQFPLDFIWIKDNKVIDVHEHIAAPLVGMNDEQLPRYSPQVPADALIEVKAGFVQYYKIKEGDIVQGL